MTITVAAVLATVVLALALAACLLWASTERTRRLAAEQSARVLADRVDVLSGIRDRLLTSETGLRRDLVVARSRVGLLEAERKVRDAPPAEVLAAVDAVADAAAVRRAGGGDGDRPGGAGLAGLAARTAAP